MFLLSGASRTDAPEMPTNFKYLPTKNTNVIRVTTIAGKKKLYYILISDHWYVV